MLTHQRIEAIISIALRCNSEVKGDVLPLQKRCWQDACLGGWLILTYAEQITMRSLSSSFRKASCEASGEMVILLSLRTPPQDIYGRGEEKTFIGRDGTSLRCSTSLKLLHEFKRVTIIVRFPLNSWRTSTEVKRNPEVWYLHPWGDDSDYSCAIVYMHLTVY